MDTWIVTGGAGFIGCNFVRTALAKTDARSSCSTSSPTRATSRASRTWRPIAASRSCAATSPTARRSRRCSPSIGRTAVLNFAAESHVDRSIDAPDDFVRTNVVGTFELLEATRRQLASASDAERARFRFLHVSTDEVYGSLGPTGAFSESTPYEPNSPYSASKAGADHLVRAYHATYGVPALITNCSNNYGPYQFPEKLIPLMILNALEAKPLPIYGDGRNVRDWLYVEDHCAGILLALQRGQPGQKYNLGGFGERANIEIVDTLCAELERVHPAARNAAFARAGVAAYADLKRFVTDRPGHDRRYAIDSARAQKELGWQPAHDLASGLAATVRWYLDHRDWCEEVQSGRYRRERLGLAHEKGDSR
jgi:dTDP-glucose 4,6-dehydratase